MMPHCFSNVETLQGLIHYWNCREYKHLSLKGSPQQSLHRVLWMAVKLFCFNFLFSFLEKVHIWIYGCKTRCHCFSVHFRNLNPFCPFLFPTNGIIPHGHISKNQSLFFLLFLNSFFIRFCPNSFLRFLYSLILYGFFLYIVLILEEDLLQLSCRCTIPNQ